MREQSLGRTRPGLQGRAGEKSGFFSSLFEIERKRAAVSRSLPPCRFVTYSAAVYNADTA